MQSRAAAAMRISGGELEELRVKARAARLNQFRQEAEYKFRRKSRLRQAVQKVQKL